MAYKVKKNILMPGFWDLVLLMSIEDVMWPEIHLVLKAKHWKRDLTRYSLTFLKKSKKVTLTSVTSSESDLWISLTTRQHCAPLGGPFLSSLATPLLFSQLLHPNFPRVTPISSMKNRAPFCSASQSHKYITIQKKSPIGSTHGQSKHKTTS